MRISRMLAVTMLLLMASRANAACQFSTAELPLLELYTSEGCSSCPPAERFVSTLNSQQVLVLAFHVDYWDDLGWPDRFADRRFTLRQRDLAEQTSAGTYTPGFFLNGEEWRGFFGGQPLPARPVDPINLGLSAQISGGQLSLTPISSGQSGAAAGDLHIAIRESGLSSQVTRGENEGRNLRHDFVVRKWLSLPATNDRAPLVVQLDRDWDLDQTDLVVWREQDGRALGAAARRLRTCAAGAN